MPDWVGLFGLSVALGILTAFHRRSQSPYFRRWGAPDYFLMAVCAVLGLLSTEILFQ